jgi:hypothetical protein
MLRLWNASAASTNPGDFISSSSSSSDDNEPSNKRASKYKYTNEIGAVFADIVADANEFSSSSSSSSSSSDDTSELISRYQHDDPPSDSYSDSSQSSFSSISSLESDSGNNFIQPEGDASRLPQDCVDLTSRLRSVPYSDLLPLFKKELSKLSNSTLPDCRLRLSRFKR